MLGSDNHEPTTRDALRTGPGRLYRSTAVMEYLDLRPRKFWELIATGRLRAVKQGRNVYITEEALHDYVAHLPDARPNTAETGTAA